jgi:hypothetical protein
LSKSATVEKYTENFSAGFEAHLPIQELIVFICQTFRLKQAKNYPVTIPSMKVFLSVSYSSQVDSTGKVIPAYRKELEAAIGALEKVNHEVYCAPREDRWTLNDTSPAEAFNVDMQNVANCELFIAFIGNRISAGIQMEIGYALANGKQIVLALPSTDELGYVNQGLVESGNAELIRYESQTSLIEHLKSLAEQTAD